MNIRPAAVAGLFYPDNPARLKADLEGYFKQLSEPLSGVPKAIIVPHAAYIYSASVAASAYGLLMPAHNTIKQVILLGPSHRVGFKGVAISSADYFETPMGQIKLDPLNRQLLLDRADVILLDQAHEQEHSLEVQLPFLQFILDDFNLTPLVVGRADRKSLVRLMEQFWDRDDSLIVISSDLSHYHEYTTAKQIDNQTSRFIQQMQADNISSEMACGQGPLTAMLELARQKHGQVEVLNVCNSGDTAGSKDRVVGYGSYAIYTTH